MRLFLGLIFVANLVQAQAPTLDVSGGGTGASGYVKFYDPTALGKKADKLEYSDVRGNCFWESDWSPAVLIIKNGKGIKMPQVKLNFYSNEVHYTDPKGTEYTATIEQIRKILIYEKNDTSKIRAVFMPFASFNPRSKGYAQILSDGKIIFLKKTTTELVKDKYDPMLGKSEVRFVSTTDYFLIQNRVLAPLKKLNKQSLMENISPAESDELWLKENKNKLKSEEEIAAFLNYRNSLKN
ncbi:MAG: hypothetical protein JSS79_05740 [Bacteroidetes bacterium]|nr:hypothetical protein [Bacteroidota bacterium]